MFLVRNREPRSRGRRSDYLKPIVLGVGLVFVAELVVMALLPLFLKSMEGWEAAVIDAVVLSSIVGWVIAVSLRKMFAANERANEIGAQYQSVVESQSELLCRYDSELRLTFVNPAYCKAFGLTADELLGRCFLELIPPEYHASIREGVATLSLGGASLVAEHPVLAPEGLRWQRWTDHVVSVDGQIEYQSFGWDITDRKNAEDALRQSEERLRALLDALPDLILRVDRFGTILEAKGARAADRQDFGKQTIRTLFGEEAVSALERAFATRTVVSTTYVTRDGKERRQLVGRFVTSGDDEAIMIVEDVTEQSRAESELIGLKYALDQHAIVAMTDLSGAITFANQKFVQITGYAREELIGANHRIINSGTHDRSFFRDLWHTISKGQVWRGEICNRAKDGRLYWVDTTIVPLKDVHGSIVEFVSIRTDITARKEAELELRRRDELLRRLSEQVPGVIYQYRRWPDGTSCFPYASEGIRDVYGIGPEEIIADPRRAFEVIDPEDLPAVIESTERSFAHCRPWHCEFRVHLPETGTRWLQGDSVPTKMPDGSLLYHGYIQDITARKSSEAMLLANEEKLRGLFELSPVGIALTQEDGTFVESNPALDEFLADDGGPLLGRSLVDFFSRDSDCCAATRADLAERGLYGPVEIDLLSAGGERRTFVAHGMTVPLTEGTRGIWHIFQDVTAEKQAAEALRLHAETVEEQLVLIHDKNVELEEQSAELEDLNRRLEELAITDALTGLPNRRGFEPRVADTLTTAAGTGRLVAAYFVDLDNFKFVNDTLGHEAGDDLLRQAAQRMREALGPDATVSRFGGDEFNGLLAAESIDELDAAASRLVELLRRPMNLSGTQVAVAGTVGVAIAVPGETSEELLANADSALYEAKGRGKSQYVFFEPWMRLKAEERREMEIDLRQAIENQEFRLLYQPIVDLDSYTVHGAEALIRWEHPERGIVAPDQFLPIAEEAGLMPQIGAWVLTQACTACRRWEAAGGESPHVFVNLSGSELHEKDVVARVERTFRETGVNPARITLEVSENTVMDDPEPILDAIQKLRDLGVRTALDDFGSGLSSIGRLTTMPVSIVKTDRSLLKGIQGDLRIMAVFRAVSALCHAVDVALTVEGIEDQDALEIAMSLGCRYGQGYLFGKPMSEQEFLDLTFAWSSPAEEVRSAS